jgi:hypothetical protein
VRATPFYRECMKPMGWRHAVALFFWHGSPPQMDMSVCVFRDVNYPRMSFKGLLRCSRVSIPQLDDGVTVARGQRSTGRRPREPGDHSFVMLERVAES